MFEDRSSGRFSSSPVAVILLIRGGDMRLRSLAFQAGVGVSISSIGVVVATQWVATRLGHQTGLGPPWFHIRTIGVYRPWSLFFWWYRFGTFAPHLFDCAGLMAAGGGCVACATSAVFAGIRSRDSAAPTTYGSARWANTVDVHRAGFSDTDGVFVGHDGRSYLRHDGPEHVIAIAPTRSGKGVGLVVPTLLSWTGSAVIHDIKGENWRLTAGWRSSFSHCLLFNPTDSRSAHYNPLLEVRRGVDEIRDVQNIADILVDPEGALERRNHWEKTSHALLVGAILHVLYLGEEKTLAGVAMLLSDPSRSFTATLDAMMTGNHLGGADAPLVHPVVASAARELLNKSENERSGVLSTAMSFLGLYRDPIVADVTSRSDWRIADLVERGCPASLYLVVPPSDISRTKPLIRLVLNQIGRRLTEVLEEQSGRQAPRLLMMLDEFPALGRLDFFETTLAFMAGYGIRAYLIAQSLNQISKAYGEANSIVDNCHVRIVFSTNDERTASRISDALGTATERREMRNHSGPRFAVWLPHISVAKQDSPRPLLTPGEIMQMPATDALVMVSGSPPIQAKKLRYYEDFALRSRVLAPPALGDGLYSDRPRTRPNDWCRPRIGSDARPDPVSAAALGKGADRHEPGRRKLGTLRAAASGQLGLADDVGPFSAENYA
jgi:type IV secretion system protein VirD4